MGTAGAGLPKHMEMWARSPECLLPLCFPESCWAGAQAGQGLCAWQDPGWLPGLEIRQAWVQSGGARPLGHFPRLFLEEDEDTQCRDPLPCQEVGGQPRACPWLPHEGHRLRGGRQDL